MNASTSLGTSALADTISEGDDSAASLEETASLHDTIDASAHRRAEVRQGSRTSTVLPRVEASEDGVRLVSEARARYEAERVLGRGGMGVVDLARDHDIDRRVAIKRIRPEAAGELGVARFAEEVRTIGRLEHPNIVPVHDVGIDEHGQYFLVMKYVEGETLATSSRSSTRGIRRRTAASPSRSAQTSSSDCCARSRTLTTEGSSIATSSPRT